MFVLPTTTAPAARSRRATWPSSVAGVRLAAPPKVVTVPATTFSSLIATGTPCSGPRGSPRCWAASREAASARASSVSTEVKALRCGSSAAMRASVDSSRSAAVIRDVAIASTWAATPPRVGSSGRCGTVGTPGAGESLVVIDEP